MKNEYISNNKIIDPMSKAQFKVKSGLYNLRKYNYASKFDRTAALGYFGKYIDSVTGEEKYCIEGCQRCWEVGYCFECKSGYYLQGRKCIKNEYGLNEFKRNYEQIVNEAPESIRSLVFM